MILYVLTDVLPIVVVTAILWTMPMLTRPTQPFGVRVPPGHVDEPVIREQRRRFSRRVLTAGVIAAAATAGLRLAGLGLVATAAVLVALVIGDLAFNFLAYQRIRAAKRDRQWYEGTRQTIATDTSLRTDPVRFPWLLLIPAGVLLAATAIIGVWRYDRLPATLLTQTGQPRVATTVATAFSPVFAQLALLVVITLVTMAILRARPDLDAARPVASARRYRVYLRWTAVVLLLSAAGVNATLLVSALRMWEIVPDSVAVDIAGFVPVGLVSIGWIWFMVRVGDAGHRLPAAPGDETGDTGRVQRDDDRYWHLAGVVYLNRQDPALLVPKRLGLGWTLNLGHPVTWAILAALVAFIVLTATRVIDLPEKAGL